MRESGSLCTDPVLSSASQAIGSQARWPLCSTKFPVTVYHSCLAQGKMSLSLCPVPDNSQELSICSGSVADIFSLKS